MIKYYLNENLLTPAEDDLERFSEIFRLNSAPNAFKCEAVFFNRALAHFHNNNAANECISCIPKGQ